MRLVSGMFAFILLAVSSSAFAWQKGAPESERKALLKTLPRLISEAENNPDKQLAVGYLYAQGIEGMPDYQKAAEWYQKAADQGSNVAMYLLAVMSIEGLGVPQDYAVALLFAEKIAASGDGSGYMLLGMLYESGSGVSQDYEKAVQYYGYAVREAQDIGARYRLGMLNLEGNGVPKNPQKALEWLLAAADQGDRHARYQLGRMYDEGIGVETDYVRSGTWFEKTLSPDDPAARKKISDIFGPLAVSGEDYTKSMGRMMKKDPHVKRNANFMLGSIYEKAGSTDKDHDCAKAYYGMAARAGHQEAIKRLAAIKKEKTGGITPKPADVTEALAPAKGNAQQGTVSAAPTRVVSKPKETATARTIRPAQEMDGIGEVIGVLENPVAQVVMDMIGAATEQGRNETGAGGAADGLMP